MQNFIKNNSRRTVKYVHIHFDDWTMHVYDADGNISWTIQQFLTKQVSKMQFSKIFFQSTNWPQTSTSTSTIASYANSIGHEDETIVKIWSD